MRYLGKEREREKKRERIFYLADLVFFLRFFVFVLLLLMKRNYYFKY